MTNHNLDRFVNAADLLTGVNYILSVETVQRESPADYKLLANYYTRYKGYGETAVLPHLLNLVDTLINRHNLVANPSSEPVRALLQVNGWNSVVDCIRGCTVLMQTVATTTVSAPIAAALSAQVNVANMDRLQGKLVDLHTVNNLCELYNQLIHHALTDELLDTKVQIGG